MSSAEVELNIHRLLSSGLTPEATAQQLTQVDFSKIDKKSSYSILNYLFNANSINEFVEFVIQLLTHKKNVHWGLLAQVLKLNNSLNKDEVLSALMDAARENKSNELLLSTPDLTTLNIELSQKKNVLLENVDKAYADKKNTLIEKVNFFKYENLIEQERNILKQIEQQYGESSELKTLFADFNKRWAHYLITNRQLKIQEEKLETVEPLPGELQPIANLVYEESEKLCQKSAELSYDFAIMFYFFDDHERAIKILQYSDLTAEVEWLRVELLINTRRFVEALELCRVLEAKYNSIPDAQFASTFSSARSLWGLGKKNKAIELMQSIVNIKPNYRSADSLLNKWKEGLR